MKKLSETNPQNLREHYISLLEKANNSTECARELADNLFALDLTMYSSNFSLDSLIYKAFAISKLDNSLSLHPEQLQIIEKIEKNDALIISAPTSFGKTYCVFEYIARYRPKNIVLVVPTLALVDEYLKRVIRKYQSFFKIYKVHTHIDETANYDFSLNNLFIITHDRIVQEKSYELIQEIDYLVIDEVYKLETDPNNDRVLVLNMAYYYLAQKAKKYVLLAPFIGSVEDIEMLEKKPVFHSTQYSPVVNQVIVHDILRHEDRYAECQSLLTKSISQNEKTLVYFPTVSGIYKYVNNYVINEPLVSDLSPQMQLFLDWAKEEIHEDWCVIKAMERGYLIHNGQIPMGSRMFQLESYESEQAYNRLLCTSTLLEGVNTTAKNIIITKPARNSERNDHNSDFSAFDFFNLVGRTGRLYQHYIGKAFYLKAPGDPNYTKIDAVRSIRFEVTDDSKDIDIQTGDIDAYLDVREFLALLGISLQDYRSNIGSKLRFETVKKIYYSFIREQKSLIDELQRLLLDSTRGRFYLISILYKIIEGRGDKYKSSVINSLLNKTRPRIKKVVNDTKAHFRSNSIDGIISTVINMKTSYIEHQFYSKVLLIRYFLELSNTRKALIDMLDQKVLNAIEYLYFTASKQRKMLVDLGIYERDVEAIIRIIGEEFSDAFELKSLLAVHMDKFKNISFISRYVISNLIE